MPLNRDVLTAGLATAFALILLAFGSHLPAGTAVRMGPGFIPRAVAIGLLAVAVLILIKALLARPARADDAAPEAPIHWRGAASISFGVLTFALLIQPIGLLASATATVFFSSLAQQGEGWGERVVLAGSLAAIAGAVFAYGLGLPLPILPNFL
ncbi:tripartite tricarboxylate transporter TctB family protein [Ancylobacter vacuolatus]|uniref:Tricarboxylic transport membrane protein n=1 Tax=Ancylobacter vacuolatus TaxID=223389 RepID=A0ABU0DP05_9HYPH|nr:tripartite tricarboxylate transporter TctB family protein [Ancylobacter vacuolatus]MDQ0350105.1 putative tricarboxylic transport membrane protein [Ancylobacter vacuolatus]